VVTTQNFSMVSGDDQEIQFTVADTDFESPTPTLDGATVYWQAFYSKFSTPGDVVISKSSLSGHGIVIVDDVNRVFVVTLERPDTLGLIGNFYHEAKLVDETGNVTTVTVGIMTLTQAKMHLPGDP
jgi:hypothetical protein